ncbi:hypothetical protein BLNAU_21125 [Blattamonas nauphoetae]|uniref:Uncharacterized protein n=1 Tax=Blattamonas nauphoetae TaxID=2049346 RepID=A0ABQ9WWV6_9EUKA|nr:hypothetical protein BLNAU_21125 [Blattamonas nauphoetae]
MPNRRPTPSSNREGFANQQQQHINPQFPQQSSAAIVTQNSQSYRRPPQQSENQAFDEEYYDPRMVSEGKTEQDMLNNHYYLWTFDQHRPIFSSSLLPPNLSLDLPGEEASEWCWRQTGETGRDTATEPGWKDTTHILLEHSCPFRFAIRLSGTGDAVSIESVEVVAEPQLNPLFSKIGESLNHQRKSLNDILDHIPSTRSLLLDALAVHEVLRAQVSVLVCCPNPVQSDLVRFVPRVPRALCPPRQPQLVCALLPNATALFHFAASVSNLTSGEICFSGDLIHRLVALEIQAQAEQRQCVVSEHNLGTMLVIALILSNKTNADRPLPIAWWAAAFRVPVATLVSSEAHLLSLLRWHVAPHTECG